MQQKTKKLIMITSIVGVISIITIGLFLRSKRKKLEAKIAEGSPEIMEPAKVTTTSVIFPLKNGSGKNTAEKNAVKVVQRYINAKSLLHWWLQITSLNEDGLFGPLTQSALQRLAGVNEVSYSFFKEMQSYLEPVPDLLSPNAKPYSGSNI